jgi:hypothetical protein
LYTRTAIFEGEASAANEETFFLRVTERLVPIWRRMPNVVDLRVYRPVRRDDGAPHIVLIQEIDYASLDSLDEAMTSPLRAPARAITDELLQSISGRVYHVISRRSEKD